MYVCLDFITLSLSLTPSHIHTLSLFMTTGVNVTDEMLPFRKERLKIDPLKDDYLKDSEAALSEMR